MERESERQKLSSILNQMGIDRGELAELGNLMFFEGEASDLEVANYVKEVALALEGEISKMSTIIQTNPRCGVLLSIVQGALKQSNTP